MPTVTPDQGLSLPIGVDVANNPAAFNNFVAGVEPRLTRLYVDTADRVARQLVVAENEVSMLGTENRAEIYDGTNNISLHTRSLYAYLRKTADQTLTPSNTTLQNITGMSVAVPITSIFGFRGKFYYEASTTADIKWAFTIPAAASMRWGIIGPSISTSGDSIFNTATASGTAIATGGAGVGTFLVVIVEGDLTIAGTAGTFQLQAAQNTSDASATTFSQRSSLEIWRVS